MSPIVTIALPVLNGGMLLRRSVLSILRQTLVDWELLVLDDGSSDGAVARLSRLMDPRIILIIDGENRGLSARLNQAVSMAKGKYFARMDHDDVCHPERLAREVEFLEDHSAVDLLATQAVTVDEVDRLVGVFSSYQLHRDICRHPWLGFSMAHPTWMARTEWISRYRYREPGPYCCEDQELLLRTYLDSEYATLEERLLAYRVRTHTPWRKLWRTRLAMAGMQRRHFASRREWGRAMLCLMATAARLGLDMRDEVCHRVGLVAGPRASAFLPLEERQWWSGYLSEFKATEPVASQAVGIAERS